MISASEADAASVLAAQAALEAAVAAAEARVAWAVEELPGGTHFVGRASVASGPAVLLFVVLKGIRFRGRGALLRVFAP